MMAMPLSYAARHAPRIAILQATRRRTRAARHAMAQDIQEIEPPRRLRAHRERRFAAAPPLVTAMMLGDEDDERPPAAVTPPAHGHFAAYISPWSLAGSGDAYMPPPLKMIIFDAAAGAMPSSAITTLRSHTAAMMGAREATGRRRPRLSINGPATRGHAAPTAAGRLCCRFLLAGLFQEYGAIYRFIYADFDIISPPASAGFDTRGGRRQQSGTPMAFIMAMQFRSFSVFGRWDAAIAVDYLLFQCRLARQFKHQQKCQTDIARLSRCRCWPALKLRRRHYDENFV